MGLYDFYQARFPGEAKFYDRIPPLVEKKYLKTMINCHECAGTLDSIDCDGERRHIRGRYRVHRAALNRPWEVTGQASRTSSTH